MLITLTYIALFVLGSSFIMWKSIKAHEAKLKEGHNMKQYRISLTILSYIFTLTITLNTGSFFMFKQLADKLTNLKYINVTQLN